MFLFNNYAQFHRGFMERWDQNKQEMYLGCFYNTDSNVFRSLGDQLDVIFVAFFTFYFFVKLFPEANNLCPLSPLQPLNRSLNVLALAVLVCTMGSAAYQLSFCVLTIVACISQPVHCHELHRLSAHTHSDSSSHIGPSEECA